MYFVYCVSGIENHFSVDMTLAVPDPIPYKDDVKLENIVRSTTLDLSLGNG